MFDILIKNAIIIDGSGSNRYTADIAINGQKIIEIGKISSSESATNEIDAKGLVVAPGFINMLSHAYVTLYEDGRSMSDLYQGVTMEIFGEGFSMGPITDEIIESLNRNFTFTETFKNGPNWTSLNEYLQMMEKRGLTCNIGSYLGTMNLRMMTVGEDNKLLTKSDLSEAQEIVHKSMQEGAFGLGSALIYPPDFYYSTQELNELAKVVGEYNGSYTFHMRSEAYKIESAIDEVISITKNSNIRAHIHHLKLFLPDNWKKGSIVIKKIEEARSNGLDLTANMYTYAAAATGLTSTIPTKYLDGGFGELVKRLKDQNLRPKIISEMTENSPEWENLYLCGPDKIIVIEFQNEKLKDLRGKSVEEIAKLQNKTPEECIIDLLIEDNSRIDTIYHGMNERNLEEFIIQPWVSFGSDEGSYSTNDKHLSQVVHPRSYGSFMNVLSKYTKQKQLLTLEQAIRKLTYLPASVLGIEHERGLVKANYFADLVVFDPNKVETSTTYENQHNLAKGMEYIIVNGELVLKKGEITDARPGNYIKHPI